MTEPLLAHAVNGDVPSFQQDLLDVAYELLQEGEVERGMNQLLPGLQSRKLSWGADRWQAFLPRCLGHPLRQLLHQDPFTRRAFEKPRGYAGDAELLDFVYGREEGWPPPEGTTELGRKLFEYTSQSHACEAVRARRGFIADLVDRLVEEVPRPHILSVAAGHLREVLLCAAVKRRKIGRYVALDSDPLSVEEVRRCYAGFGVEPMQASVRQVLTRKGPLGPFDLVYSTGLFDYVPQAAAQRLTEALFQLLRPRGRLLVANFLPGIRDVGYMEAYMDWRLLYRTRREMLDLSLDIPQEAIHDIRIFCEEGQNIIFLQITRR
jgi:extracellular factor (EF) 3-hydroxypalmitic acid methyl ester biosynthesis protein